jgi:hypothetical protein
MTITLYCRFVLFNDRTLPKNSCCWFVYCTPVCHSSTSTLPYLRCTPVCALQ